MSEAQRHLQRPPSWAQADMPPPEGAWCAACHGQRWWTERHTPKGWRCSTCHPHHLAADQVAMVGD